MSGAAFQRLGPRARDALRRSLETAMRGPSGRPAAAADVAKHYRYALDLIETALIVDAAEAAAQDPHA